MYIQAWKKKNFVHLAIPKNGLITYGNFLKDNGWIFADINEVIQNHSDYKFWANIRNPHMRHTKGLSEFYTRMFVRYGKDVGEVSDFLSNTIDANEQMLKYWVLSITDQHTLPISYLLEPFQGIEIEWLPIDTCVSSETITNYYFKENGINLEIEERDRGNVSGPQKKLLQTKMNELKEGMEFYQNFFTPYVLAKDIEIYNFAVKNWSRKMNNSDMLSSII